MLTVISETPLAHRIAAKGSAISFMQYYSFTLPDTAVIHHHSREQDMPPTPIRASLLLAALLLTSPAWSADPVHKEKVELTAETPTHSVKGKIKGYATAEYTFTGKAGQTLSIKLKTNQPSNYFNLRQAGKDEALFIGSSGGNNYQAKLPADGEYTVQVYLMRNAARRNAAASYSVDITLRDWK